MMQSPIVPPTISPIEKHTRRGIVIVIIIALFVVAAWFVYQKYYSLSTTVAPTPFSQLSTEEQERQKELAAQDIAKYNATLQQPTEKQKAASAQDIAKYNATVKQPTEAEKAAAALEMATYAQQH